ncbi:MAG TPA: tetratricopeptide repeat protein [Candidatus Udaeobacter sp.]|nr:tetratricopeptide repeat protein [Candidatus Udaeobacter sp.]
MAKHVSVRSVIPKLGVISGICAVLAAITWLVFGQTLAHQFVTYDDPQYVYENAKVAAGLSPESVLWAFTHTVGGNWHPLTVISHMLDCQLYGLKPAGHHFTNLLLHTIAVILLFLVLRRMTGTLWQSAFVAALFAIHPLHVESVAWISERKDLLSAVFFMLTLGAYIRYVHKPSLTSYILVLLVFAFGLMSKPMLVTVPFVLLLLDYWPLKRFAPEAPVKRGQQRIVEDRESIRRILLEKIPLLLFSFGSCAATLLAQRHFIDPIGHLSLINRFSNAAVSTVIYLRQLVWPFGLSVFYPHPRHSLSLVQVSVAALFLIAVSAAAFMCRRRHPYFFTGWFWFLGMLVPVSGIIQVGEQAHADRYMYLPQIGLYILVTWFVADTVSSWRHRRILLATAMASSIALLVYPAWKQTSYWRDGRALWTHALAVDPQNDTAHISICDLDLRENRLDDAILHARKALEIRPDSADAESRLGVALSASGQNEEASIHFRRALETHQIRPRLHYNLASLLLNSGHLDEAIAEFQKELQIQPEFVEAHNNLGIALRSKGELDEALAHFQKALELDPHLPKVHHNIAMILLRQGQLDQAVAHLQKELQVSPASAEAHNDLGIVWSQQGRIDRAINEWQKTLELQPGNLNAYCNLVWVFATFPDDVIRSGAKAVALGERALQLSGEKDPRVYRLLAAAYAENHQFDKAIETAQRGSELATKQGNYAAANALESNIDLYRKSLPLRDSSE